MDFSRPVSATDLLKNLHMIHDVRQNYVIISDSSMTGSYLKLVEAINTLDELGWETLSISHDSSAASMFALLRRIQKAKNSL